MNAIPNRFDVRVGAVALLVVYYHSALVYVCQLRCDAWAGMSIVAKATAVSAFMRPPIRLWPDAYNVAKVQKYSLPFVRNGWKIVLTLPDSSVLAAGFLLQASVRDFCIHFLNNSKKSVFLLPLNFGWL